MTEFSFFERSISLGSTLDDLNAVSRMLDFIFNRVFKSLNIENKLTHYQMLHKQSTVQEVCRSGFVLSV